MRQTIWAFNHFYNLFEVHFELLFPAQGETTTEARKQEKAAVLNWAKEIRAVRDPESHPPSDDMDLLDALRQLDTAQRICSKFDMQAANQLAALASHLYSDRPRDFGRGEKEASHRQPIQATPPTHLQAEALLLGPVQALGLRSRVEASSTTGIRCAGPMPLASMQKSQKLSVSGFSGYADRFERLGAMALRAAGDPEASHDLLMQLAIRDLWDRAEPKVTQRWREVLRS